MSFTSPTITYTTSIAQKLQSRSAALKIKNGSPELQELLRNKCRIRVKEQRYNFFSKMRNISEEAKKMTFDTIIREGISEMEQDLELQELIFKEIQQDAEQWLIEEFEKEENYWIQKFGESNVEVFCPICQKSVVQKTGDVLSCPCGLRLLYPNLLSELQTTLENRVSEHGSKCANNLIFFIEPKGESTFFSLNAMCTTCDYLTNIVD